MDKQVTATPKRKAKSGRGYAIAGITKDGVRILKMPGKATHFTDKEISDAIRAIRTRQQAVASRLQSAKKK